MKPAKLLTRDQFREGVFARDQHKCVFCAVTDPVYAHHIVERRLFPDGGYYLDNGITVCEDHHRACERTDISTDAARKAARINTVVLPPHFEVDRSYDKWSNIVLPNGTRLQGELFSDEKVRSTIAEHLHLFVGLDSSTAILKYPRTAHVLGSRLQEGDSTAGQIDICKIVDGSLVVEEKIDGANCAISFNSDAVMILQSRGHVLAGGPREAQFALFKTWTARHEEALFDILTDRYIMYGEWCAAKHTIFYDRLPHYFLEFDIYDKSRNVFVDTDTRHELLVGSPVVSVPVVHRGLLRTAKEMGSLVRPSLYKSDDWRASLATAAARARVPIELAMAETNQSDMSEGLYFKHERAGRVVGRYKYVRHDFLQSILDSETHVLDRTIIANQLAPGVDIW